MKFETLGKSIDNKIEKINQVAESKKVSRLEKKKSKTEKKLAKINSELTTEK